MTYTPSYSDEDFYRRLKEGHEIEVKIASFLREWGFDVTEPVFEFRKNLSDIGRFTRNQTDLVVNGLVNVEIKSIKAKFTSPDDYPFKDVVVESVHGFESKERVPDIYILHSKPTDQFVVADTRFKSKWKVKTIPDRARSIETRCYVAPRELLRPPSYLEGYLSAMSI